MHIRCAVQLSSWSAGSASVRSAPSKLKPILSGKDGDGRTFFGLVNNSSQEIAAKDDFYDRYTIGDSVGMGSFAEVKSIVDNETGDEFAVKIMKKFENPNGIQEVEMIRKVTHDLVMPLLDVYETLDEILLIVPKYTGVDMCDYLASCHEDGAGLEEEDALVLCAQMLSAAEAVHRAGVVHLDIKPENFMFKSKEPGSDLVLIDFGSAEPMKLVSYARTGEDYDPQLDDQLPLERLTRVTGTAHYLAPEVVDGRFSSRSDVFSVGVCLCTLLTGFFPFSSELVHSDSRSDQIRAVASRVDFTADWWQPVSTETINVIKWMLRPDPQLRCSSAEAVVAIMSILETARAKKEIANALGRFERTKQQSLTFRKQLLNSAEAKLETSQSPYNSQERCASRVLDNLHSEGKPAFPWTKDKVEDSTTLEDKELTERVKKRIQARQSRTHRTLERIRREHSCLQRRNSFQDL